MKRYLLFIFLTVFFSTASADWLNRGYLKYGFSFLDMPFDSPTSGLEDQQIYQRFGGRLMTEKSWSSITVAAHYDIQYIFALQDSLDSSLDADPGNLFDLTAIPVDQANQQLVHRFDRLYAHYRGKNISIKAGRQALTWGHGMMFQVMDIFNPFSPVALDTDYKNGNDMLYGEWLTSRGDDVQVLYVPRNNAEGDLAIDSSAFATKFHGLLFETDFDILIARNNNIELAAIGLARPIRQSMWRLDVLTNYLAEGELGYSFVTNLDYSWVWLNHNVYGFVEYMYDSEGQRIQGGLPLLKHHYAATSLRIELHPLVNFSPSIISSLEDNSGLFYLTVYYDWMQDLNASLGAIIPYGEKNASFSQAGKSFQFLISAYF
ncbi:MAG: hypothetical protein OEX19_08545 [Gammaproteobacteria bacterium]|nr:hypothetical protein [Gammaproteobacteria bacterium]